MIKKVFLRTNRLSGVFSLLVFCSCLFFSACASTSKPTVYVRSKIMNIFGKVTAKKNIPVINIRWDFQEYDIEYRKKKESSHTTNTLLKSTSDCFRAELVYQGGNGSEAVFEKRYFLCQRVEPLGIEHLKISTSNTKEPIFHGVCVTLLNAGPLEADIEIDRCGK